MTELVPLVLLGALHVEVSFASTEVEDSIRVIWCRFPSIGLLLDSIVYGGINNGRQAWRDTTLVGFPCDK